MDVKDCVTQFILAMEFGHVMYVGKRSQLVKWSLSSISFVARVRLNTISGHMSIVR